MYIGEFMARFVRRYPVMCFVLGVLIPVHGILWPLRLSGAAPESLQGLKILFALLPTSVAFLLTMISQGEEGVRQLWGKTFLKQKRLKFYGIALIGIASLGVLTLVVRYLYDGQWSGLEDVPPLGMIVILAPFLLLFPGFTEEFGWRAFLQERLQGKMGVFLASLLTGLVWGAWHAMDFLMGNWPTDSFSILVFFLYITPVSILIGSVYFLSGGSVFVAILAHFSANIVNFFLPVWQLESGRLTPMIFLGLLWLSALLMLLNRKIRLRPAP